MNSQPKWDIHESVVLLKGYLLACKKSEPRAYIIRRVSADLRAMAIHRGRKIDEIFRNESGISYQMQSMDSAYKGRKIYVPATKLFQETVSLYRNQNSRFQELLKEARYMIEHDIAHPALNDTDVFVVDFNDCPDMSFARVNSLTYRGQAILIRPKWRDLYIALLKKLYADYSNEIDSVVGKVYGRASAPFVGNCHSISLMRSPGEFAPDRYVELNISATTVIVNIKTMLDICGTSYEDVNITYTKGNKDQMEALLKVQNIRTVFSAELLSIAGTIISDIFPNGLRKSSQIARKKFAAAYKNTTGRDFQDNIDLDALALQVGLEYEDKIYVPSKETKEFLKKLIDNIREQEYRLVYYEELYNAFSEQLSADKIFSAEMLKRVLEAVAPEMVFYKTYACFSKNDSLVDDIIRAYGNDIYIDYHEIKSRLPYVDLYQIRLTCSRSPEFVSMGDEVYALSGKIYLSKNDVEAARRSIAIATILDTYPSNAAKLNREEQRVLKTVLMMQAISKKMNNGVELLRPTVQNLGLAFEGDDSMENNRAINIARNQLVQKKILYIDTNGSVEEFAASAIAGDQVQIDAIKDRLRKETKTAKLIDDGDLMSAFTFNSALRARYNFQYATVDNFKVTVNRINNMPKSYKFNAVICIARTEEEQTTLRLKIAEAVRDSAYADIIFIDATSNIMGADRFEQWISVAAQTEYWRPKDPRLADNKQTDVKRTLADWKNDITGGKFTVYFGTDFKENASSMTLLKEKLAAVVLKVYPLSFDNCNVSDQFFTDAKYADAAKKGIAMAKTVDFTRPGIFQEKYVKAMLGDALGIEHFEEVKPHLSISKLKLKVKTLIDGVFEKDVRIAISDLFDYLMKEGFMPCSMYAYLAGFLLSDYSDEPYRYGVGSAGDDGGKMTAEELGNDIGEYVKNKVSPIKNYKEKYIEIMTPDQKAFVDFAAKAFGIAENLSVEQAASKVRIKLRDIGYPIWCFKAIDTNSLEGFIDKLAEISNSQNGGNVPTLAGQMGKMLLAVPSSIDNLAQLLTSENGYKAMGEFLHDFEEGQLLTCAEAIGIPDVMVDVKKQIGSGEATWLWNMDTGLEELRKLLVDYKIILQSTQLGIKSASFFSCMQAWKEYTRYIKSPASVITAKCPELMYFIGCLKDIAENGEISHEKHEKFLAELTEKASIISALKEEKIAIFKETYSLYLVGFNDAEVRKVYNTLPASSFTDDKSTFEKNVSAISDEIRSEQERFRLLELWEEKTGTKNAYEWSEKNRTPIKAMVSVDEQVNAFKLFDAINYPNTEASRVSDALSYLKSNPGFIASLTDKSKIDTAFIRVIVKKYYAILTDLDAVRDHLEKVIPKAPYSWYGDPAVSTEIEKLANSKYRTGGNSVVMQRIDKMDAEEAKKYLRKLVQEDVEVGISIISKEGI